MAGQGINVDLNVAPELDVQQMNVLLRQLKQSLGTFGKNIKLIDGKEFAKEIATVKQQTDKTGSSFKNLNKDLATSTKSASVFQNAFKFSVIQQSVVGLTNALQPMISEYIELDKNIKNIGTLGVKNFEEFRDISLQMAADIPGTATDMANGIYQAISAGAKGSAQEIGKFVEVAAKAGVAGLSDTTTAVNGLTSVLNAYGRSYDDANEVADTFFAGIKLGKTSFSELNSSLASFIPSASAMEVGFDQATAAISRLTAVGTPTAQAGTQMNAAFTLLAKGTTPLKDALKTVGTDLSALRDKLKQPVKDGGGLVNVFREIKTAADASGKQLAELTGSVEAAKIIESLAGSNEKYLASLGTFNDVTSEIANGAATKAFDIAATSIAAKADGLFASIQNGLSGVFSSIGPDAVAGISVLNQYAPALSGVSGAVATFGSRIKSSGGALLNFAKAPVAGVTGAVTKIGSILPAAGTAFRVFWAAATGPIGLLLIGLAAAATAIYLVADALHVSAEEALENAQAEEELAKQQRAIAEEQVTNQKKRIDASSNLIDEYERLGSQAKLTGEEEKRFIEIQNTLTQAYPEAVSQTNQFTENLKNLRGELEQDKDKLGEYTEAVRKAKLAEAEASANTAEAQVDVDIENLEDTLGDGLNDFFDTGLELRENRAIIKGLADQFKNAANDKEVLLAKGKALEFINNSDDLTSEEKSAAIAKVNAVADAQIKAFEANNEKIQVAYEQDLDRINEQFKNNGIEFSVSDEQIAKLAEQSGKSVEEVTKAVNGMEKEARQSKVGDILKESSKIQGDIKKVSRLDDLIKAFNEAETVAQKSAIGGQIQKIAPQAIEAGDAVRDANGNMANSYKILGENLDDIKEKQDEQYGNKLLAKQKEFVNAISEEGDKYQENKAKSDELLESINKDRKLGLDTSEAEAEFQRLTDKNKESIGEVVEATAKLASQGEVSNEVYAELGEKFGISGEEMKKMVDNAQGLTKSLEDSISSVEELGAAFKGALDGANDIQSKGVAALSELERQRREGIITDKEFALQSKQIETDTRNAIKERKNLEADQLKIKKELGLVDDKKRAKEKDIYDIIKKRYDLETKGLDQKQSEFELENETIRLNERREKNVIDDLAIQENKNNLLKEQKQLLLDEFKLVENTDGTIDFGINFKSDQKEKTLQELESLNQEIDKNNNSALAIRIKIDEEKSNIQKQLNDYDLKRYQLKIDLATDDETRQKARQDLINAISKGVDSSEAIINDLEDRIHSLISTEATTGLTEAQELALQRLRLELAKETELKRDQLDKIKKLEIDTLNENLENLKDEYDKRKEIIEKSATEEEELKQRLINTTAAVAQKSIERQNQATLEQLDLDKQARIDAIGDIEASEELKTQIEANYQAKRLQQEKDYQQQQKAIQAIQQGEVLEATRQKDIQLLEQQKSSITAQLELLQSQEDPDKETLEKIKELTTELGSITTSLDEKSDQFKFIKDKLGAGLTDTFAGLFQGDAEAMKEPFRESMQVVAGALKAQLQATILKLVLEQLSITAGVGLAGLILAPILQGIIGSGLSALLNPVISGLTSFSSGGRIDSPTVAWVGDASQARPGSDTEWIFRDDQISVLMGLTAVKVANAIVPKLGLQLAGYQAQIMSNTLSSAFSDIYPILRHQALTVSKLSQIVMHQVRYQSMLNRYSGDKALSQLAKQSFKVNSYATGSGALTKPELALIGDANEPEYVLLQSQLNDIVERTRNNTNIDLSEVVNELKDVKTLLAGMNIVIGDETIFLADQRERNKRNSRNRG